MSKKRRHKRQRTPTSDGADASASGGGSGGVAATASDQTTDRPADAANRAFARGGIVKKRRKPSAKQHARAKSASGSAKHPFDADAKDHCETSPSAYEHIAPVLRRVAKALHKTPAELAIYDPCARPCLARPPSLPLPCRPGLLARFVSRRLTKQHGSSILALVVSGRTAATSARARWCATWRHSASTTSTTATKTSTRQPRKDGWARAHGLLCYSQQHDSIAAASHAHAHRHPPVCRCCGRLTSPVVCRCRRTTSW